MSEQPSPGELKLAQGLFANLRIAKGDFSRLRKELDSAERHLAEAASIAEEIAKLPGMEIEDEEPESESD